MLCGVVVRCEVVYCDIVYCIAKQCVVVWCVTVCCVILCGRLAPCVAVCHMTLCCVVVLYVVTVVYHGVSLFVCFDMMCRCVAWCGVT